MVCGPESVPRFTMERTTTERTLAHPQAALGSDAQVLALLKRMQETLTDIDRRLKRLALEVDRLNKNQ